MGLPFGLRVRAPESGEEEAKGAREFARVGVQVKV